MDGPPLEESTFAVFVALAAALLTTGACMTSHCAVQYECLNAGTCRSFNDGTCSFSNVVSPAGFKMFNLSSDAEALAALTRGVCSAGERQALDQAGRLTCVRAPAFPVAFNAEAADPEAEIDHERACGKWVRSKAASTSTEYFSFYDEDTITKTVMDELKSEFDPNIAVDDVDRFRQACERMLVSNAMAPAASAAYEHLKGQIGNSIDTNSKLLKAMGKLTSHYCDSPILLGVGFGSNGFFLPTATDGVLLDGETATEALYAFGEASEERERVRAFIGEMETAPASLATAPTQAQINDIVAGAIEGSSLEDTLDIAGSFTIHLDGTLDAGSKFLYAVEETDFQHARAYLLAVASQCAFATRSATTGEFGSSASVAEATKRIGSRKRSRAAGLGRLEFDETVVERFSPVNSSHMLEASTVTWSRLSSTAALYSATSVEAHDACWATATKAFPDALDTRVLNKLTTTRLLTTTLPPIVAEMKEAVAIGLQSGRMATLVADPAERATLAANARATQFQVAGAARGSTFGRSGEFERPALRSDDGALLILLKQARAVFLDRIALALENHDLCSAPPLFPSLTRNAYLLSMAPCAMLLPGILVPPFASDRYDEASLFGRIGYVIAHEIAHVASREEVWDASERARLLVNYTASTHAEAAADLTAADAIVSTGKVSVDQLCGDVSQLWCAREPDDNWLYYAPPSPPRSHPRANLRGDALCAFLRS